MASKLMYAVLIAAASQTERLLTLMSQAEDTAGVKGPLDKDDTLLADVPSGESNSTGLGTRQPEPVPEQSAPTNRTSTDANTGNKTDATYGDATRSLQDATGPTLGSKTTLPGTETIQRSKAATFQTTLVVSDRNALPRLYSIG